MQTFFAIGYTLVALIFLLPVGNEACRLLLDRTQLKAPNLKTESSTAQAGKWIGILERLILAIAIIGQSWEAFAAVIALKSVARFSELDQKAFAEYFLVGSLFSILWTIIISFSWLAFDHSYGIGLQDNLLQILTTPESP